MRWLPCLGLLIAAPVMACINTFETDFMYYKRKGDAQGMATMLARAEDAHRKSPTLENTNDLAAGRILSGRVSEGIQLLRELEAKQPGNAVVAANLGTALELAGDDEEALKWIRESVRRDPREHEGSEWVHVKILEAKLALKQDPNWLRKNSILGWREGQRLPLDEISRPRRAIDIIDAIQYQLDERIVFVEGKDPIVADLHLTIGDIAYAVPGAIGDPWRRDLLIQSSYEGAIFYGTPHEARARQRMAAADARIKAAQPGLQAAAAREEQARRRELDRERLAASKKQEMIDAQRQRRWMAFGAFALLGVVVSAVVFFRRRGDSGTAA
jgi:hypothetical protein